MYTDFLKKARKTIADISPLLGISGPDFDTEELTFLSGIHLTGDIEKGPLFTITYDIRNGIYSISKRMKPNVCSSDNPDVICNYLTEQFSSVEGIKDMIAEINKLVEDGEI
jgi:hypothetical protein